MRTRQAVAFVGIRLRFFAVLYDVDVELVALHLHSLLDLDDQVYFQVELSFPFLLSCVEGYAASSCLVMQGTQRERPIIWRSLAGPVSGALVMDRSGRLGDLEKILTDNAIHTRDVVQPLALSVGQDVSTSTNSQAVTHPAQRPAIVDRRHISRSLCVIDI